MTRRGDAEEGGILVLKTRFWGDLQKEIGNRLRRKRFFCMDMMDIVDIMGMW
jgi:predicted protein tyrosine phosphatase